MAVAAGAAATEGAVAAGAWAARLTVAVGWATASGAGSRPATMTTAPTMTASVASATTPIRTGTSGYAVAESLH